MQEVYRRDGLPAVIKVIAERPRHRPRRPGRRAGLTPQPLTPERTANFGFFVEHDFTAIIGDTLDVAALKHADPHRARRPAAPPRAPSSTTVRAGTGRSRGHRPRTFPGGHNGNLTHPRAYAARVRELLSGA